MRRFLPLIAVAALAAACSPRPGGEAKTAATPDANAAAPAAPQPPSDAPAGEYAMDLAHTSILFRVSHIGMSHYTGRFTKADGKLKFDPANPAAQSVTATIDARSLQTDYPEPAKLDFDAQVQKEFLETAKFPQITFKSTKVEPTGPRTAKVTGDLTLHGVTRSVSIPAQAQLVNGTIQVAGSITFPLADFDITAPNVGGFILSIADEGTLEFQVNFAKA
jgi:polyisoprenoid-binding protein YceI